MDVYLTQVLPLLGKTLKSLSISNAKLDHDLIQNILSNYVFTKVVCTPAVMHHLMETVGPLML